MSRRNTVIRNWPRYLLQWGVLIALVLFILAIIPSTEKIDPERYCPMGGLQALTTWLVKGTLPCSMTTVQILMGVALAAAVMLFSKLFCGYLCPIGTVEDLVMKIRKGLHLKSIVITNGSIVDAILRIFKYVLLFWIFYSTATASELFCKSLDPYYAVATGFKGEIVRWMSITTILLVTLGGFLVDSFWCKYVCPLGAISNTMKFWVWVLVLFLAWYLVGLTGLVIPWWILLGAFCLTGYLLEILHRKPKMQLVYMVKDAGRCTHCGLCSKRCPQGIDVNSMLDGKIAHVDCTLCGECSAVCSKNALDFGFAIGRGSRILRFLPALLTLAMVALGIWLGTKYEVPTIDVTWGKEVVGADGSTSIVTPSGLKELELSGLNSVHCYGSSMAFKAKVEKIGGIYGVRTYVGHHRAILKYDPAEVTPEEIREQVFEPSSFRVNSVTASEIDQVKVIIARTENMYDKMDINHLGMQLRNTGKRIYGVQTQYDCPMIVRIYMDPAEEVSEGWLRSIIEKKTVDMPAKGGTTKPLNVDFKFVRMEKEVTYVSAAEYFDTMLSKYRLESARHIEAAGSAEQYVYQIADQNYEKPVILRSMPNVASYMLQFDGVLGVYLDLDEDLVPAIKIRFAEPMSGEKIWELLNQDEWSVVDAEGVKHDLGKLTFRSPGKVVSF